MDSAPDEVLLSIPAQTDYGRIVRVGAAALALRHGMSFGEIDDLRTAVDEAIALLLDGAGNDEATVDAVFRTVGEHFEVAATLTGGGVLSESAVERFDASTSGLIDDYDLDAAGAWVRLRKTPVPVED